jgi:putative ABC transport system substrate-binding protein
MTLKKILPLAGALIIGALAIYKLNQNDTEVGPKLPIVAITQIVEHPSLDMERESLIETLAQNGFEDGRNIKIIYQNAQGNISLAAQIATKLISEGPSVIVAISTPSAQAAQSGCTDKKIPLVFTAVTDPLGAKLIEANGFSTPSITGVTDRIPNSAHFEALTKFAPQARRFGVIYNPGEINSVVMVEEMKAYAAHHGLEVVESVAIKTSEASTAMQNLVGKVDLVYVPNDNTAIAAMKSIALVAEKNKIPLFAADMGAVKTGAVAALGYDRKELGHKAGLMVVDVLKGKSPKDIPLASNHTLKLFVNKERAEQSGLDFSSPHLPPLEYMESK